MFTLNNARALPQQAQAVLLIGGLSVVYLMIQMLGLRSGDKKNFNAMVLGASVLAVAVSTYNINCLISGKCSSWASVLAVMYVITQGGVLLTTVTK